MVEMIDTSSKTKKPIPKSKTQSKSKTKVLS
jgi:hypothetical protein